MPENLRPMESFPHSEDLPAGSSIMIISDTSESPTGYRGTLNQGNGAQSTVGNLVSGLRDRGHDVILVYPDQFHTFPVPKTIHSRSLAFVSPTKMRSMINMAKPDAILNRTPLGPLGWAARRACLADGLPFTSTYNTNHLDYLNTHLDRLTHGKVQIPDKAVAPLFRRVYGKGEGLVVYGETSKQRLGSMGIENISVIPLGVDAEMYRPLEASEQNAFDQYGWGENLPVLLYAGRIAVEKGVEKFLATETPGFRKAVIGDGPSRPRLEEKYTDKYTHFLGPIFDKEKAWHMRSARLAIQPSTTETWAHVIAEFAASGTPVIVYDAQGARDIITQGQNGVLLPIGAPLNRGIEPALQIERNGCAEYTSKNFPWNSFTAGLLSKLKPIQWES